MYDYEVSISQSWDVRYRLKAKDAEEAKQLADALFRRLSPDCPRIPLAGSVKGRKLKFSGGSGRHDVGVSHLTPDGRYITRLDMYRPTGRRVKIDK